MLTRFALLAFAFTGLTLPAQADVIYSVTNPSAHFVFFTYDSPAFITTDTLVTASELSFNNSIHPAVSVDFIIASPLDPGFADVQITISPFPGIPTVQDKFVSADDLARYGKYQAAPGSFGYPNSYVDVAAPEPGSLAILAVGLIGLSSLRRRLRR